MNIDQKLDNIGRDVTDIKIDMATYHAKTDETIKGLTQKIIQQNGRVTKNSKEIDKMARGLRDVTHFADEYAMEKGETLQRRNRFWNLTWERAMNVLQFLIVAGVAWWIWKNTGFNPL